MAWRMREWDAGDILFGCGDDFLEPGTDGRRPRDPFTDEELATLLHIDGSAWLRGR